MSAVFNKELLRKMLETAFAAVDRNVAYLNQLDSAIGDGDHGTAIVAAMRAAVAAMKNAGQERNLSATLETVGWDIMSGTSGSTSALTGSFFTGMSSACTADELDIPQTVALFEAGLANVKTGTKAQIGDKTLMDALLPAIEAMSANKNAAALADVFQLAAAAAQKGADSTKDFIAKHGRAKNLGERSKGYLDAGAVSTALIYKAYQEACSP